MSISLGRIGVAVIACAMSFPVWGAAAASSSQQNSQFRGGKPQTQTAIHFADIGNVWTWTADNPNEMYIQSNNMKWYRVTFWAPCLRLPYAIRVAFVTEPNGDLNAFSSVLVHGERCWFRTFEQSEGPPKSTHNK